MKDLLKLQKCFLWFMGDNSLRKSLYDYRTGGCAQSLTSAGVSKYQGAESSLAYWISYHLFIKCYGEGLFTSSER
jgi:hypothetical protein